MTISPGKRLGPYEILSTIGAGGIDGCRAKDTRLDRIVAVKVLPSHAAGRDGLRERFEREARRFPLSIIPIFASFTMLVTWMEQTTW